MGHGRPPGAWARCGRCRAGRGPTKSGTCQNRGVTLFWWGQPQKLFSHARAPVASRPGGLLADPSAAMALLWMRRSLQFLTHLPRVTAGAAGPGRTVVHGEASLGPALRKKGGASSFCHLWDVPQQTGLLWTWTRRHLLQDLYEGADATPVAAMRNAYASHQATFCGLARGHTPAIWAWLGAISDARPHASQARLRGQPREPW